MNTIKNWKVLDAYLKMIIPKKKKKDEKMNEQKQEKSRHGTVSISFRNIRIWGLPSKTC